MATNENGSHTGKVAFVTGAGSGIGRAAALVFAREGGAVVVVHSALVMGEDTPGNEVALSQ